MPAISKRKLKHKTLAAICSSAALGASLVLPTSVALAGTDSWIGTAGGNWTDGTQWSAAAPPGNGDDGYITTSFTGTQTISYDYSGPAISFNSVTVDATGGGLNVLSQASGNFTVNQTSSGFVPAVMVGYAGNAVFNQSGGTNTMTGGAGLFLAGSPSATGTYILGTGAALVGSISSYEVVGQYGTGKFFQTGGTNSMAQEMILGFKSGATGTYTLDSGAVLSVRTIYVGDLGAGDFNQTGGTATATFLLGVGLNGGSTGSYTMATDSDLLVRGTERIGEAGYGNFNQTGGSHTVRSTLYLADAVAATGNFSLTSSATLSAGNEYIGNLGLGNFVQTNATNTVTGSGNVYIGYSGVGHYNLADGILTLAQPANGQASNSFYLGYSAGATGTFSMSGNASLKVPFDNGGGTEAIGYAGSGTFDQNGGANEAGVLSVARNSGSIGSYTLENGGSLFVNNAETIGEAGTGTFSQSGGSNLVSNAFTVASGKGSTGTYTMSGGTLEVQGYDWVGSYGMGSFIQSGGLHSATSGFGIDLAEAGGSSGYYSLSGSAIVNAPVTVGAGGMGVFNQPGGTVNGDVGLGFDAGSSGVYTMGTNATLNALSESIGYFGNGTFLQNGGTNSSTVLIIAQRPTSTATFTLSAGSLAVSNFEQIGYSGNATFTQIGGTNSLTGSANLEIGAAANGTGNYTLSGGRLSVGGSAYVGGNSNASQGIGSLAVSGPACVDIAGTLQIWGKGSVRLSSPSTGYTTVGRLQIAAGGLLDVTYTALTINYGSAGSPNASVRNYISSGYNAGASLWTGTGITSTAAAGDPAHHSVAFADGADGVVTHLPAGISSAIPNGGTLPSGSELVTYAFAGDANLDGKVDFLDFIVLSNHFGAADINWDHGNFNYDANVDFADFIVLSNNFGAGTGLGNGIGATPQELAQYNALAAKFGISQSQIASWDQGISNLPEPGVVTLLLIGPALLLLRRRPSRPRALPG